MLLSVIASAQPTPAPVPNPGWTSEDWTIAGVVVAVIALIAAIAVPVELHRRKERSERNLREKSAARRRLVAKKPTIESAMATLNQLDEFARHLERGSVGYEEMKRVLYSESICTFLAQLRDGTLDIFSTEESRQARLALGADGFAVVPAEADLERCLRAWQSGAGAAQLYALIVQIVDTLPRQRQEGAAMRVHVNILREDLRQTLARIESE